MKLDFSTLQVLHPRSLKHLSGHLTDLVRGRLWLHVIIGMALGIGAGIAIGPTVGLVPPGIAATAGDWLSLPGQIFLGLIQMIVMPLVFASIIRGLAASEDLDQLKRMGSYVILFFVVTTTIAIIIGIALATLIEPGRFVDAAQARAALAGTQLPDVATSVPAHDTSLPETIIGLVPRNPLSSMLRYDMLHVVLFALMVGIALVSMQPAQSKPVLELLGSLQEISLTIVKWAMRLAPVAVFCLMTRLTSRLGLGALAGMSVYVGTVLAGLLVLMIVYLIILAVAGGQRPLPFLRAVREVQLLAFSTSSSAAVMPLSIKAAEDSLDVRPSVSQLVIPLGATINMNGTALYQGVATVFLAQVFGVDLGLGELALVVVTAVAASIGSPATPGVGIVILSMVLGAAGVPAAGLGLIIGVDRILDMARTALNVTGDLVAARVLDRKVGGKFSARQQRKLDARLELEREQSGDDVVIDAPGTPAANASNASNDDHAPGA